MPNYSNASLGSSIELEEFRQYAERGPAVAIVNDQRRQKVIAVGETPDGRTISWLEPGLDTTRHFIIALERAFGPKLAGHTVRELNLVSRPGQPLSSQTVRRAVDMAETARTALDGVDFLADIRKLCG